MTQTDSRQTLLRLRILLTHLAAHDHDHECEIAHHVEALGDALPADCRPLIDRAVEDNIRARRSLAALLDALGGPLTA